MAKLTIRDNNITVTIKIEESPKLIAVKPVKDSDGWWTDYSWYQREDGTHFFIFGDTDVYGPEDEPDWECDSWDEAHDWFTNYCVDDDDEDEEEENLNLDLEDLLKNLLG